MRGDCYLCCALVNNQMTKLGNFLEDDFDALEYRKFFHPYCAICPHKQAVRLGEGIYESVASGARKSLGTGQAQQ